MHSTLLVKRTVGITAIISGILSFACLILSAIAIDPNFDILSNPALILTTEDTNIQALKWSMISCLFGYYLLLLPVIFYLYEWMNMKSPWRLLYTFSGTSYVLIGALGASILTTVLPSMIIEYQNAVPAQRENLKTNFQLLSSVVYGGMWNLLEVILGSVWWIGIGCVLQRWKRIFGYTTIILGGFTLLNALGTLTEIGILSVIGLNTYLILAPVWTLWLGIILIRG